MVLFATFIGGTAHFFGPILGAILVTYLQLGLSRRHHRYGSSISALIFIGVVMFAPGGIAGLLMMHRPLLRAGSLGDVLPSYLLSLRADAGDWRAASCSRSKRSRVTPQSEGEGNVIDLFGIPSTRPRPSTWAIAAVSDRRRLRGRPHHLGRVGRAWDRATTAARDRGCLA